MHRKLFTVFMALAIALTLAVPVVAENTVKSDDTVILYTNDVHTYIDGNLSYDVIAALKDELETQYENVLLVDAGDHIQGTAYGSMDKGKTIIDLMNASDYDVATLGNHEFDYGMEGCLNAIDWADYSYVSCNFYHECNGVRGENVLGSYKLFSCGDEKIAFIGITTPETFSKSTPAYFQDEDGNYIYGISGGADGEALYADVQAAIDQAEAAGATTVIGLGHLGIDLSSQPWTSEETIANVSGLDAFIDGHSHSTVEGKLVVDESGENVLLTQTGQYFDRIGMMIIDADTGSISTKLLTSEDISDITPDETVGATKDAWIQTIDEALGQKIGTFEVTLDNYDSGNNRLVRSQETNSGDFCADALYYLFDSMDMDVDVAIMNGGGIRNVAVTGDVTYKTCKNIHTFGNVACLQTVTGQQILDALEWGARMAGTGEQNGGFLQVSGLTYKVDTGITSTVQSDVNGIWTGSPTDEYCVHEVMVYNKDTDTWDDLNLSAKYNLAGYNYTLRDLGDGFAMFDGAINVLDYVMEDYMVLANYIQSFEDGNVSADNSPLMAKYPSFTIDYSTVDGSGRIDIGAEKHRPVLYVDGVNALEASVGNGWSYDKETNTLTLNGARIDTGYAYVDDTEAVFYAGIYSNDDLNIRLTPDTESTVSLAEQDADVSVGILAEGNLNITGDGTLNATSGQASIESIALEAAKALAINGSTVIATGGTAGGDSYSVGIEADSITVVDGNVTAYGGEGGVSCGIYSYGTAVFKNSHIQAQTIDAAISSAILASSDMTIENSTVTAVTGNGVDSAIALDVFGNLNASNSKLFLTVGNASGDSPFGCGISAADVSLNNCTVGIDSGLEGIYANNVTVVDSDVTINAKGNGIHTQFGSVTINCTDPHFSYQGSPRLTGTRVRIDAQGNYGIYAPMGLTIDETLTISTPLDGNIKELEDPNYFTYMTITDQTGNVAKTIEIEPLGYTVSVHGLSYSIAVQVPAGKSINETHCEHFQVEDFSELLDRDKEGYTLAGWYTDADCTEGNEYNFNSPVSADLTIYAKWVRTGCDGIENCPSTTFIDLDTTSWYHKAADYVIEKELMKGISSKLFDPTGDTSRAMVSTILWRMAGSPESDYTMTFGDVDADAWYADSIRWAASMGIVVGYSDTKFGPDDTITREQFVTMLWRYAEHAGYDISTGNTAPSFSDMVQTSSWAQDAMVWACKNGIINGKGGGILDPKGNASRVEAAQILMNFINVMHG